VVPIVRSKVIRDTGSYESGETLPNLDRLLDRTLTDIAHCHESRERSSRSFDSLWEKVCRTLKRKKNAANYELWKRSAVIKNGPEFRKLDEKVAAACASAHEAAEKDGQSGPKHINLEEFETLRRERAALKPKAAVTVDDLLEVAIAYWIEAKDARNFGDDTRALHALIKCSLHIGMALSPKTESESKSEAGARNGQGVRQQIADIATTVLKDIRVDVNMRDPSHLLGTVGTLMQKDPEHSKVLMIYNKRITTGKKVKTSLKDRLPETLLKWVTSGNPPYPELSQAYRSVLDKAASLKSKAPNRNRCQANS
jgi:hypothetical protein